MPSGLNSASVTNWTSAVRFKKLKCAASAAKPDEEMRHAENGSDKSHFPGTGSAGLDATVRG
jgi:hypothetical protein